MKVSIPSTHFSCLMSSFGYLTPLKEPIALNIVNMLSNHMSQGKNKRIPVSENIWKKLGDLKGAGETYDDVLEKMIRDHNRMKLARKMKEIEEKDREELVPLDEL